MPREIIFETNSAIFYFELPDAVERLKYYSVEHRVTEATEILETISSSASKEIRITSGYFAYIILDLLHQKKGSVYCNPCQNTYEPSQLQFVPLGFGRNPFEVNLKAKGGVLKTFFGRKKRICGQGGEGYECPNGHRLIGIITWTGLFQIPTKKGGEQEC